MTPPRSLIVRPRVPTMACRAGVGRITATMTTKPRARASKVSGTIAAPRVMNMPRTLIGSADQALGAGRLRGAVAEVECSGRQSVLLDARSHRPSIGVRGRTLRAPSVRSGWGSVCSAVLYNAIQHSQSPPGSRVTPRTPVANGPRVLQRLYGWWAVTPRTYPEKHASQFVADPGEQVVIRRTGQCRDGWYHPPTAQETAVPELMDTWSSQRVSQTVSACRKPGSRPVPVGV